MGVFFYRLFNAMTARRPHTKIWRLKAYEKCRNAKRSQR
jgi:hypothetical protein